jgi:hypothetical protein
VLDNANNNDTAITAVARDFSNFKLIEQRLCCSPYTINLIRQALLFGRDKDAYSNANKHVLEEEAFIEQ